DVRERRRDLAAMNKEGIVNPESNYCFGEGGAGTYSDGKLYTRSTKRGNELKSLQWFHHFGATEKILQEEHPHTGTNKLPGIRSDVRERRRDLAAMNKEGIVNPESNYCFGEGGAGTYSHGKLYTRSTKRGNVLKSLQWFHHFGATEKILQEAHPHIGTNKLPGI